MMPSMVFESMVVAGLVAVLLSLMAGRRANTRLQARLDQQDKQLKAMQADVSAMCSGAVNLGAHLAQLEQRAHQLLQRQEQLEMQDSSSTHYRQAAKMLHKGARLEEVIQDCGLARGEAELIALAQQLDKAS